MDRRTFLAAAAAPLVLGVGPALARPSGGTPLALVTADLESHVVAVDISSGTVLRRLRTPPDPRSIESVGMVGALVAHTASGRLTLIDSELRVRPVAGELGEPRYAAVSPDRTARSRLRTRAGQWLVCHASRLSGERVAVTVAAGEVRIRHGLREVAVHKQSDGRRQRVVDRAHLEGVTGHDGAVCRRVIEAPLELHASPPPALLRPLAEYEAAIGGSF